MSTESITDAWAALLGDHPSAGVRVAQVADAETCNEVSIRMRPAFDGHACEVFVVRRDGVELEPFDRCFVQPERRGGDYIDVEARDVTDEPAPLALPERMP